MDLRFGRRSEMTVCNVNVLFYLINLKSTENLIFLLLKYKFIQKKPYPFNNLEEWVQDSNPTIQ